MNIVYIFILSFLISNESKFNGESAFVYIKEQCELGPRFPGSEAHGNLIKYLYNHFSIYSDSIEVFLDTINHPFTNQKIEIQNLLIKHNIRKNNRHSFYKELNILNLV